MQRVWLKRRGERAVILFFCGWGMDEQAVRHVEGTRDVLVFYDYRDLCNESAPVLDGYEEIHVIAWSMGVWAASMLLNWWNIQVTSRVAINGTGCPVDESYGIPPKVYGLTECGMTARGRDKFFSRMLAGKQDLVKFEENKPCRDLQEQIEELRCIREQAEICNPESPWDRVYVSKGDVIFPVENQYNWWRNRREVISIEGGHYPFYVLTSWNLM